ncbi:sigma-70 family RNA polymerase sigma factor [Sporosarcina sp. FSL W7-1349]|uniref:RNA polymerase sigma factor n=1 Tax=Sporosarcina sp. FSL W7-1349 TaxID=2921561 RepID=UPI0030F52FA8
MKAVWLVKKAKKGNKEALLQLIMEQQDDYYRLALTYMGNPHDAMDAMEEMIVSLYEKIGQLKKEDAFYSWSKTILVNRCKQMLKKRNRVVLMEEWEEGAATSDPFRQSEDQMDIRRMLETLNDFQKEAIQLKYFHDLDNETIANMTEVSIGTVKSRIFQGLKKLRDRFGGEFHD